MKLYPYQKKLVSFALGNLQKKNNVFLLEAPTGTGKSVILCETAKRLAQEGRKVIVSSPTNQLVVQIYELYKNRFAERESGFDIAIGKANYLNPRKVAEIQSDENLPERTREIAKILAEKVIPFAKKNHDLISDMALAHPSLAEMDLDEDEKRFFKNAATDAGDEEFVRNLADFENLDIAFTNHHYLLSKVVYGGYQIEDDTAILIDEVHLVSDAAETIFSVSFSPYGAWTATRSLANALENTKERGLKSKRGDLRSLAKTLKVIIDRHSSTPGETSVGERRSIEIVEDIFDKIYAPRFADLFKKIKKAAPSDKNVAEKTELFKKEFIPLEDMHGVAENSIAVSFSNVKGYPRLHATKGDYFSFLVGFWRRTKSVFGTSATIEIGGSHDFVVNRIGINASGKPKSFYKYEVDDNAERATINIVDSDFPRPASFSEEGKIDRRWAKSVARFVADTFENKNSMLLLGSFAETEAVSEELQAIVNVPVVAAKKGKSAQSVVERFKKIGGILVGTRNYGTGIDLKGELLEKLYIGKLPYPTIGSKKYIDMKRRDEEKNTNVFYFYIEKEMLLNLKQWKGRLIRTKEDRGDIYLLDSRVHMSERRFKSVERVLKNA